MATDVDNPTQAGTNQENQKTEAHETETQKAEKAEKTEKAEKAEKTEKAEKAEAEHAEQGRAEVIQREEAPQPSPVEPRRDTGEPPIRSLTLTLPFFRARFEVPRTPTRPFHVGSVTLPSPGKAAYYVGLGALAVAEVVEWPVAVAIGAGTYVAQHTRADEPTLPQFEHAHAEVREEREQRELAGAPA